MVFANFPCSPACLPAALQAHVRVALFTLAVRLSLLPWENKVLSRAKSSRVSSLEVGQLLKERFPASHYTLWFLLSVPTCGTGR